MRTQPREPLEAASVALLPTAPLPTPLAKTRLANAEAQEFYHKRIASIQLTPATVLHGNVAQAILVQLPQITAKAGLAFAEPMLRHADSTKLAAAQHALAEAPYFPNERVIIARQIKNGFAELIPNHADPIKPVKMGPAPADQLCFQIFKVITATPKGNGCVDHLNRTYAL